MPRISVIIPTFNRAEYLGQAIQSALDQTYPDLEVIVVDDGSTDGTAELVRSFKDRRLSYIYQENRGKGAAINRGFSESTGQLIGKLDSDDWYLPGALLALAQALEPEAQAGVAAGGYLMVDQQGKQLQEVAPWITRPDLNLTTWVKGCPVLWQGALVRREWFEKVGGFNPQIQGPDDWDFGLRLAADGCSMQWVPRLLFNYRLHTENSIKHVERFTQECISILDNFFSSASLKETILDEKRAAYFQTYINCAGREYAAGLCDEAKQNFSKALQLDVTLLERQARGVWRTIAWWSLSPLLTRNPEQFIRTVAQNLPGEVQEIKFPLRRAYAEKAAVIFFQSRAKKDWTALRRNALEILRYFPSRFFDRGVLAGLIESVLGSSQFMKFRSLIQPT